MELKYTKDGRKVAVLGKLNSEEFIVQEIFVTGGQEVPGGENFVAKGLLDKPAESWKEKKLRETEASYERRKKNMENELERAERRLTDATQKAKLRADALMKFEKNAHILQLDTLRQFLYGQITHFYMGGYSPEIFTWDDMKPFQRETGGFGRAKPEALKLISLFGTSDGNLDFKLHDYSDGSGCSMTIYPCRSYEEALAYAQKECDEQAESFVSQDKGPSFGMDRWLKIDGIKIPEAAREKAERQQEQIRQQKIAKLKADLAALESE